MMKTNTLHFFGVFKKIYRKYLNISFHKTIKKYLPAIISHRNYWSLWHFDHFAWISRHFENKNRIGRYPNWIFSKSRKEVISIKISTVYFTKQIISYNNFQKLNIFIDYANNWVILIAFQEILKAKMIVKGIKTIYFLKADKKFFYIKINIVQ